MSAEEISDLKADLAEINAILRERASHSDRNGRFLHAITAAVAIQLVFTIFYAGSKTMQLDRLQSDVHDIQYRLENLK